MAESVPEYVKRKLEEMQQLIEDATRAGAINAPQILDGYDQGGAHITITIRIVEPALQKYRKENKKGV